MRWGTAAPGDADTARDLLLDAAEACFERSGISGTTMDDIAKQARVSRATVYRYFTGRDTVVAGVILRADGALPREGPAPHHIPTRSQRRRARVRRGHRSRSNTGRDDRPVVQERRPTRRSRPGEGHIGGSLRARHRVPAARLHRPLGATPTRAYRSTTRPNGSCARFSACSPSAVPGAAVATDSTPSCNASCSRRSSEKAEPRRSRSRRRGRRPSSRRGYQRTGMVRGPRTWPPVHVTAAGSTISKVGMRSSHSSIATFSSMRARFEPKQRWMPFPNAT